MKQNLHEIKHYKDSSFPVEMYYITRDQIVPSGRGFMDIHWHEDLQLTLVTNGTLTIKVNDTSYILNEGEAIFINRNLIHITTNLSEHGQYISFNFPDKMLSFFSGSYMEHEQVLPYTTSQNLTAFSMTKEFAWQKNIIEDMWQMYELFEIREDLFQYKISLFLAKIWCEIISNINCCISKTSPSFNRYQKRLQTMLHFIHHNYSHDIHPSNIAESANISIGECNRCFRQLLSLSPMQYLSDYRITQAADLLMQKDLSITEIATMCGYNNTSYFIQKFRRKMHMTPSEYRKR